MAGSCVQHPGTDDEPYAGCLRRHEVGPRGAGRDAGCEVGHFGVEVATAIADVIEVDMLPLRIPIGEAARRVLAARQAAPDNAPS